METLTVFDEALAELLGIEGGFSDIEADRGGATNWGITEGLARRYGYEGDMRELPFETARSIYRQEFWENRRLQLGEMALISPAAAKEVFEQAVNTGYYSTAKRVQRVLNILNRDETLYRDLTVDGFLWGDARRAMTALVAAGDAVYLLQWLNVAQGVHYFNLCESDPTQEAFSRGWIDKRVKV